MRCWLNVNDLNMEVMIDTGAAISAISDRLRRKLGISINEKSNVRCILANGNKIASLGKAVVEVELTEGVFVPLRVEVIDSNIDEVIIGNDMLERMNVDISFRDSIMILKDEENRDIIIPVKFTKERVFESIEEVNEDDYTEEEYNDELDFEEADMNELYTIIEEPEDGENVDEDEAPKLIKNDLNKWVLDQ